MTQSIAEMVASANELAKAGRWPDAERVWLEVQRREPRHPQALFSLGMHALHRGDLTGADGLLQQARAVAPRDLMTLMGLAKVAGERGDPEAEREAIEAALAVDPYFVPGLLARGSWQERQSGSAAAARTYRNALKISPPRDQWPSAYRPQLEHARNLVERYTAGLSAHLTQRLAPLQAGLDAQLAGRWDEAASILAGRTAPYHSHSNQLHVPRLAAVPFYDRAQFPWLATLEARTTAIRDELLSVLAKDRSHFSPYIAYRPGEPVNQWTELNHSLKWSALHLWRSGQPVAENLARCPETARVLSELQMADIPGLCPNVMFSALAPKTHIPPHHGETNARLVAHLPLIVPPGCRYRVGFEQREWKVGETLIFDDTIEHEARNDGDELRVVLIFDLWNPQLSPVERELVNAMAAAAREFQG